MRPWFEIVELTEDKFNFLNYINQFKFYDNAMRDLVFKFEAELLSPGQYEENDLAYSELSGTFDFIYQLLRSEYVGQNYESDYYTHAAPGSVQKCEENRDGCYWEDERDNAREFYISRTQRPGLIFKFDTQIIDEDYESVKKRITGKLNRLVNLSENRQNLFEQMWSGKPSAIRVHTHKDRAFQVYPLSDIFLDTVREVRNFHGENGDIFLELVDWSNYVQK